MNAVIATVFVLILFYAVLAKNGPKNTLVLIVVLIIMLVLLQIAGVPFGG